MGGYLIALSNGIDRVYQPIGTFVIPKWTSTGYELEVDQVSGAPGSRIDAKSKKITSTKTVTGKGKSNKTKTKITSQIGDNLNFMIKTPIPNYPAKAANKKFSVQDHPDLGLTINTDSIKVKIENGEEIESKDYSMSDLEANAGNKHGKGFKVEFDQDQYKKLAEAGKKGKNLNLIVTYSGTLNGKAPISGGTKNSAHPLIPKNLYESGAGYTFPSPAITEIYTYGIKITKIGKAGKGSDKSTKLSGAEFKLYRKSFEKNGDAAVKVKKADAVAGTDSAATGKYIVDLGGSETITSGPEGLVQIDGLGAGTYILKETRAPGGYVLPADPIAIVIKDNDLDGVPDTGNVGNSASKTAVSTIGGKSVTVDSNDNRLVYTLTNKKANFKLPKTGAIGAVIFGVVGVALIITSAALVVVHRRRKTKRSS